VPVEADSGKFIGMACGLNAKGPQPGVDSHVTPVRYLVGRVCKGPLAVKGLPVCSLGKLPAVTCRGAATD
jgi:hypothetical protein